MKSGKLAKICAVLIVTSFGIFNTPEKSGVLGYFGLVNNSGNKFFLEAEAKTKKKKKKKLLSLQKESFQLPIEIKGDVNCVLKTKTALKKLRDKSEEHYNLAAKYIGVIECAQSGSGMYVWENPPRLKAGLATFNATSEWFAGAIVHDACHSRQYHSYKEKNLAGYVPAEVYAGAEAEKECLEIQYAALERIGASQKNLDYVKNILASNYWEIGYNERWW